MGYGHQKTQKGSSALLYRFLAVFEPCTIGPHLMPPRPTPACRPFRPSFCLDQPAIIGRASFFKLKRNSWQTNRRGLYQTPIAA